MSVSEKETITLTFGEQAENHAGMQILGGGLAKDGFNLDDLEAAKRKFEEAGKFVQLVYLHKYAQEERQDLIFEEAYILIVRNGLDVLLEGDSADNLFKEQKGLMWDTKALMRGRVVNKRARSNLCYGVKSQEADVANGKGTIIAYSEIPLTEVLHKKVGEYCGEKAKDMQVEGNRYSDLKNNYIGFHGDGERKRVIAVRLGEPFPFAYQWFYKNDTVGPRINIVMNHGDVYMMSEKASGWDWKYSSKPTLRHAAGYEKNIPIIPRLTKLVKKGNVELIEKLMKEGISPNNSAGDNNNLPIVEAVKRGKVDIVKLLVNYGGVYDLRKYGTDLLEIANKKSNGESDMIRYLKELGL